MYHASSSPYLASRFAWISAGIARSDLRNGFPLIIRIIVNVMRMTSRMTGIVQKRRRMMNFVTASHLPLPWGRGNPAGWPERRALRPSLPEARVVLVRLDLDLGQVELREQVDVERVLQVGPLLLDRRVPVDRQDRHGPVGPEQLLLELCVDLVAGGVVRRLPRLRDVGVVRLVAIVRVV